MNTLRGIAWPLTQTLASVLLVGIVVVACGDMEAPAEPEVPLATVVALNESPLTQAEYDAFVASAAVEGTTLAAATYSALGVSGWFEARTVATPFAFVGMVNLESDWTTDRDGFVQTGSRFRANAGPTVTETWSHNVDCSTISSNGRVAATTQHNGSWIVPVIVVSEILNMAYDMTDTSNDSETCPAPVTDTYDDVVEEPGGDNGDGGGSEQPVDDTSYCMVRYTYIVSTGQIIDVEILFCW